MSRPARGGGAQPPRELHSAPWDEQRQTEHHGEDRNLCVRGPKSARHTGHKNQGKVSDVSKMSLARPVTVTYSVRSRGQRSP